MIYLLAGLILLVLLISSGRKFVNANPASLARQIRTIGGVFLMAIAAYLTMTGRFFLGLPVGAFALSLLGANYGWFGGGRNTSRSSGQRSQVRTACLEMQLDHDTGDMTGTVLAGSLAGRSLDSLSEQDLQILWKEAAGDEQSRKLVEAYLDRRFSGWREDFEPDGTHRQGSAPGSGPMADEEAYQILGLSPGAGDAEIRSAHRRLMKRLHPDHGGTSFLAAKLNEAKDTLLRRHG